MHKNSTTACRVATSEVRSAANVHSQWNQGCAQSFSICIQSHDLVRASRRNSFSWTETRALKVKSKRRTTVRDNPQIAGEYPSHAKCSAKLPYLMLDSWKNRNQGLS